MQAIGQDGIEPADAKMGDFGESTAIKDVSAYLW
jgi:hypothetical protein